MSARARGGENVKVWASLISSLAPEGLVVAENGSDVRDIH